MILNTLSNQYFSKLKLFFLTFPGTAAFCYFEKSSFEYAQQYVIIPMGCVASTLVSSVIYHQFSKLLCSYYYQEVNFISLIQDVLPMHCSE